MTLTFCHAQSIGEDDDTVEASSAGLQETAEGFQPVFFDPRPLHNLVLVDEMESLSPVTDLKVRCPGAVHVTFQVSKPIVLYELVA